jgi:DNA-binding transcriptional MerR regulator/effector-binding domain-containing protein
VTRFTIGEFSRITGLPVKTLRFYHEKGLLVPAATDPASHYRYYDDRNIERARVITALRALEFSLDEIAEILARHDDEADLLEFLETQKARIQSRILKEKDIISVLDRIIRSEREARQALLRSGSQVELKKLDPLLIAGVRMKGKYSDCGKGFAEIGKRLGRYISGKPFCLYYDDEYREDDADFEACFPLKKKVEAPGISTRELAGASAISLLHRGPYDQLGRTYAALLRHAQERGYKVLLPTREIYWKGPGMIFRGQPKNYLTEVQLPIDGGTSDGA